MLSRRQFLGRTAAGASWLSLAGPIPGLFARAAEGARNADRNDHVLVVLLLDGGNDGLNTLIPFADDLYYKHRPVLAVPHAEVIKLNEYAGLHPSLAPIGEFFRAGKLAVVQGVGYPQPNRSHFRSMEIWQTASTARRAPDAGWLARILDRGGPAREDQVPGLALTEALPQALHSPRVSVPVLRQADQSDLTEGSGRQRLLQRLSAAPTSDSGTVGFLRQQAATTYRLAEVLRHASSAFQSDGEYPGELGTQLRQAAQVITGPLGVRVLFLSQTGYDHHNRQAAAHAKVLGELAVGLASFQKDLERHKVADRVVVLTFSEFGRRVDENASQGTDHGAASCLFLAGAPVKGGMFGTYPSLEKLGEGDLVYTVDFRSVYATVLEKWLGCPAEALLGGKFPTLDLVRG